MKMGEPNTIWVTRIASKRQGSQETEIVNVPFRSRKAFTVAVEGNIGSGKTTFLNRFCPETDNVDVLAEPVDRDVIFVMTT